MASPCTRHGIGALNGCFRGLLGLSTQKTTNFIPTKAAIAVFSLSTKEIIVKNFPVKAGEWVAEQASEEMRRVRVNADFSMCRANPGWFAVVFHSGLYLPAKNRWKMLYSIQAEQDGQPRLYQVMIGRILMADGSEVWGAVNG